MLEVIEHPAEPQSNRDRALATQLEPRSLRTYTPTQAVLAKSAGVFHWTPEGRRLYDYTSGVLVANLGHNPVSWMRRFVRYMGWPAEVLAPGASNGVSEGYFPAVAMTAYNAITPIEADACRRLVALMQSCPGGEHMQQVMWAASGSEAIQKALWAALARDRSRSLILATRFGFHGKKGLAAAVTGSESDPDRDPRVRFIRFPMHECRDLADRGRAFDSTPYEQELNALWREHGRAITALITEPYLGGGGSYHPPKAYLQLLDRFCKAHDILLILDEVQANFGRTGRMFAYETYGISPDIVVLGKGLGNGVPVAAAVGRADVFAALGYGEGSDTWSANPLQCASVLATLDEFAAQDVLGHCRKVSAIIEAGLERLKALPYVSAVRGEEGGMVWGVEMQDHDGRSAAEWANAFVLAAYHGDDGGDGIHLLGPLAKKVVRISPPLTITVDEARDSIHLLERAAARLVRVEQPEAVLVG